MTGSRYHIGIDLGTTNCALAYFDLWQQKGPYEFEISQWQSLTGLFKQKTLPSFCYFPTKGEKNRHPVTPPFQSEPLSVILGAYAKDKTKTQPGRVIHSAKSWLCHPYADGEAKLLPWHSQEILGTDRLSPLEVSSLYLRHLKDYWNQTIGLEGEGLQFENQLVTIGIPASFDEHAHFLTQKASRLAGYPEGTRFIEEPVAAFHAYLRKAPHILEETAKTRHFLVVDMGGGTTDFCLLRLCSQRDQLAKLERLRVSDHLLLGGDNIDLALAQHLESALQQKAPLSSDAFSDLLAQARDLKEKILSSPPPEDPERIYRVAIQTGGDDLFSATKTVSLPYHEFYELLMTRFFPQVEKSAKPCKNTHTPQDTLLYTEDEALTRHLAEFLQDEPIDGVLYTGGSMKPALLRQRITDLLSSYQDQPVLELESEDFDLAIAKGASLSEVQKNQLTGGYPRSLYMEVEGAEAPRLLCILPYGQPLDEVIEWQLKGILVRSGEEVRIPFYSALRRPEDRLGELYALSDEFRPLGELTTTLGTGEKRQELKDPELQVRVEDGKLNLKLKAEELTVTLEFMTKGAKAPPKGASPSAAVPETALTTFRLVFGKKATASSSEAKRLTKNLEQDLGSRDQWDLALLRGLLSELLKCYGKRERSEGHEQAFLYLVGYTLRPGFGSSHDGEAIERVFRWFRGGVCHSKPATFELWWMLWRRIAGGLSADQQQMIFQKIWPSLRQGEDRSQEMVLLGGALERLDGKAKIHLATKLAEQVKASRVLREQKIWALARLCARTPLYGGMEVILKPKVVEAIMAEWSDLPLHDASFRSLGLFYAQAARLTGDRHLDLSLQAREQAFLLHERLGGPEAQREGLLTLKPIDWQQHYHAFGEELPLGFRYGS